MNPAAWAWPPPPKCSAIAAAWALPLERMLTRKTSRLHLLEKEDDVHALDRAGQGGDVFRVDFAQVQVAAGPF